MRRGRGLTPRLTSEAVRGYFGEPLVLILGGVCVVG